MLRLHGMAGRADTATVCAALYEKGIEFEHFQPSIDQGGARREHGVAGESPMLEVSSGKLAGALVILDYLEAIAPETPLLPAHPSARAKVRELSRTTEQGIDLVTRPLLPAALSGAPLEEHTAMQARDRMDQGIAATLRLARFEPWIAGDSFSQADIVWHFSLESSALVARSLYGRDLYAEITAAAAHRDAMSARASVQRARALAEQ